jgi:hypothetical protein
LQVGLAARREWLATQGVIYPTDRGEGDVAHGHAFAALALRDVTPSDVNPLFLPERETFAAIHDISPGDIEAVRAQWAIPPGGRLRVLSSELFSTFGGSEIQRLRDACDSLDRVVVYTRDGIAYLHSCWQTKVRWGGHEDFAAFLERSVRLGAATPIRGLLTWVGELERVLGQVVVSRRSFDDATARDGGIVADFIDGELGLTDQLRASEATPENVSPSAAHHELFRAVALVAHDLPGCTPGFWRFVRCLDSGTDSDRRLLSEIDSMMEPMSIGLLLGVSTSRTVSRVLARHCEEGGFDRWRFPATDEVYCTRSPRLEQWAWDHPGVRDLARRAAG